MLRSPLARYTLRWMLPYVLLPTLALNALALQPQVAQKIAILVGVNRYSAESGLRALDYAENDVAELAGMLHDAGYKVVLLTEEAGAKDADHRPTKAHINRELS